MKTRISKNQDNNLICCATILDPRVKDRSFISSDLKRKANTRILSELKELEKEISASQSDKLDQTIHETQSNKKIKLDVFAFIKEQEITLSGRDVMELTKVDQELDCYLKEAVVMEKIDVFQWWKEKKIQYPSLYQLLCKTF